MNLKRLRRDLRHLWFYHIHINLKQTEPRHGGKGIVARGCFPLEPLFLLPRDHRLGSGQLLGTSGAQEGDNRGVSAASLARPDQLGHLGEVCCYDWRQTLLWSMQRTLGDDVLRRNDVCTRAYRGQATVATANGHGQVA
ncbi:unnamed protein product [Boreogadus saida]